MRRADRDDRRGRLARRHHRTQESIRALIVRPPRASLGDSTEAIMIKSLFHVNVNCSNFERSLRFYKMLGFKVVLDIPQ
jgi:hypothetical protein